MSGSYRESTLSGNSCSGTSDNAGISSGMISMGVCPSPTRMVCAPISAAIASDLSAGRPVMNLSAVTGTGPYPRTAAAVRSLAGSPAGSSGS